MTVYATVLAAREMDSFGIWRQIAVYVTSKSDVSSFSKAAKSVLEEDFNVTVDTSDESYFVTLIKFTTEEEKLAFIAS